MHAQRKPKAPGRFKYAPCRLLVEDVGLAEHIAEAGEFLPGYDREHLFDDQINIGIRATNKFLWNLVRAEKGRHTAQRSGLSCLLHYAQDLSLRIQAQAVSGFSLDRGRTAAQKPGRMLLCCGEQIVLFSRACPADSGKDASSLPGYFLICNAGAAQLEFIRAIAGEDQMSMCIHKTGRDHAPPGVDDLCLAAELAFHVAA